MSSLEPVSHIVTKFDRLKQLSAQARRLSQLNLTVMACLPSRLSNHTRLAAVHDGYLVLQVDNAAWAAEVRYKTPELLAALSGLPEFASIRSIRVKKAPAVKLETRRPEGPRMSPESADSITAQAEHMADDDIRDALLKLASRGNPTKKKPNA